jgi:type IV pilus assembly protein PilN
MPRINLLPWREELRQKRKKDFLVAVMGAVIFGGLLSYGVKLAVQGQIAGQNARNTTLRTEIARLDEQIDEILGLESQKNRLVDRMQIIDRLQRSRPEVVHLFDELVDTLPEGAYLTKVSQRESRIEITGLAQSSTRVSALMRNVQASDWLRQPQLGGIEAVASGQGRNSQFTVAAQQVSMDDEEEKKQ